MATTILQANLNHAGQAQDLFLHTMAERDCTLGIVAEPYRVPPGHSCWAQAEDASVAIHWRTSNYAPTRFVMAERDFMMIEWGTVFVIGVYILPSLDFATFADRLTRIGACVRGYAPNPVLVAGDFNTKSALWGSPRPNRRGTALEK